MACYLIGGSLVFRSYMLTIRGVLQGLEHFGWDSVVVARRPRRCCSRSAVAALWHGTGLRGLMIAFVVRARRRARARRLADARRGSAAIGFRYDREVWRDLHKTAVPLGFFLVVLNLYSYVDSASCSATCAAYAETGSVRRRLQDVRRADVCAVALSAVLTPRLSTLFVRDPTPHGASRCTASPAALRSARPSASSPTDRDAADRVAVHGAELRAGGRAVQNPVPRAAVRVRHLDSARDRDLGEPRAAAAVDRTRRDWPSTSCSTCLRIPRTTARTAPRSRPSSARSSAWASSWPAC